MKRMQRIKAISFLILLVSLFCCKNNNPAITINHTIKIDTNKITTSKFQYAYADDILRVVDSLLELRSQPCEKNIDTLYNRVKILYIFSEILDSMKNGFFPDSIIGDFGVSSNEKPIFFFVCDLVDTNNYSASFECIDFINNHIYHFSSHNYLFGISNICILNDGELRIFKAINCEECGDNIEVVIDYLDTFLKNDPNKEEILDRVKHYEDHSYYLSPDNYVSPACEYCKN